MAATSKSKRAATRYIAAESLAHGIVRKRKGKGFAYYYRNRPLRAESQLQRIKSLAIPPAWTQVMICPYASGHLQAVGTDLAGRRQYIYHPAWVQIRSEKKFDKLLQFGKALLQLRRKVQRDLRIREWTAPKVIATAIRLMECSHMRIGGLQYERDHSSHGLTTLKNEHARLESGGLIICYKGKKGVSQKHRITDRLLVNLIRRCRELPGKRLFQYLGQDGKPHEITTTMVNQYIKDATGDNFSAKDFRTWAGSVYAYYFLLQQSGEEEISIQQKIQQTLNYVSERLGNTPTVCRKYYIHPRLLNQIEKGGFNTRPSVDLSKQLFGKKGLSSLEKSLLRLLRMKKDTD